MNTIDRDLVSPADPQYDDPPGPGEGKIAEVEFGKVELQGTSKSYRRCQLPECRAAIPIVEPHVHVHLILETRPGGHQRIKLCDRECWVAWASR